MDISLLSVLTSMGIAALFFILGFFVNRKIGELKLYNAKKMAGNIIEEAKKEAESYKREAALEARDKMYKAKLGFEKDTAKKKRELQNVERKLADRESNVERKSDLLARKERETQRRERDLALKERNVKAKDERYKQLLEEENAKLERIAGMTAEQAKQRLMANLEAQARYEAAQMIKEIKDKARESAEGEAKEIITSAIQRCATDHVAESTVSVVSLPNEEMKGRIIGREGRNIRAFETATGIEVIIDDTPEAVSLSGFDPVRRETARLALETLVADGRIHPARIEEIVAKTEKQVEELIDKTGEETLLEMGIPDAHPEVARLLGRLKYRTSYGQNVLQHSKEVAYICGLMAGELDFDGAIARRAGLLHDLGKAVDQSHEGTHAKIGAELARKYGESDLIINAILAHHEDTEPTSAIATLVAAADAVSGARPGARRETLEAYIKRLEKLEEIANSFRGVDNAYAIQAGREIRIIVQPEEISDVQAGELSSMIAKRIEAELKYPGQIKVTVIREMRAVGYAK